VSGAAYVFGRSNGSWNLKAYLKADNAKTGDIFGTAITIHGDRIAVGAPEESTGLSPDRADNSGSVYLFERADDTWAQAHYLKAPNGRANGRFGGAVSLSTAGLLVGAIGDTITTPGPRDHVPDPSEETFVGTSGAAYLY
jgi:hypothetical protein